jgi:hypothetical protein
MLQSPEGAAKVGIVDGTDEKKLVTLYERVLPYAILFGQEKEWSKQLGRYYEQSGSAPDWYSGTGAFNAALFASNMSSFSSSAASVSGFSSSSGGSSGGGFSGGGGGGGGNPQAPAQGGVAAAVQGKTPTYGGGSGSISVMGGFGINKKKADAADGENPFGKMFGKDAPKGSGVVNFRDIASKVGGKGDNIFDMISKRYTSVAADKRLLEYELAK